MIKPEQLQSVGFSVLHNVVASRSGGIGRSRRFFARDRGNRKHRRAERRAKRWTHRCMARGFSISSSFRQGSERTNPAFIFTGELVEQTLAPVRRVLVGGRNVFALGSGSIDSGGLPKRRRMPTRRTRRFHIFTHGRPNAEEAPKPSGTFDGDATQSPG